MHRDFFRRGPRFSFSFGALEDREDPLGLRTFPLPRPTRMDQLHTPPLEVQSFGEYRYGGGRSAVVAPNGRVTSLEGPSPDLAMGVAMPAPVGVIKRRSGV